MTRDMFQIRENAFEYEFFHRVDEELLAKLRLQLQEEEERDQLAEATGIKDEAVLEELREAGLQRKNVLALTLYPLVHVAWADGVMSDAQRSLILEVADEHGIREPSEAYQLLLHWLGHRPEGMFDIWKDYMVAAMETLPNQGTKVAVRDSAMNLAFQVAQRAGSAWGGGGVRDRESDALERLKGAFEEAGL